MRSIILIQLFLMSLICWQIPFYETKKIVTFFGRITPFEQQLFGPKEDPNVKKSNSFMRMFSKSKIEYEDKKVQVPIIWTVEIVECVGCDTKYGPQRPSDMTENGTFQIRLKPKFDDERNILKLVVKIKSAEGIPMRKNDEEDGDWHRVGHCWS